MFFMRIGVAVRVGAQAIRRNLMRSVLTMLGIVIGVAAVIAIVALGQGAKQAIEERITAAGANMIVIRAGNRTIGGVRLGMGASSRLTAEDAASLRSVPTIRYVSPGLRTRQQVVSDGENWSTSVEGCGADMALIRSWKLHAGSFFGEREVTDAEPVAVLGSTVRDMLFGASSAAPVGSVIRIGLVPFRVIGVLESRGDTSGGGDQDDAIYVPYSTVQKRLMGVTYLDRITIGVDTAGHVPQATAAIESHLRIRHAIAPGAPNDFRVQSLDEIAAVRSAGAQTMTWLLAAIAAVSLVVGGVGVMNIMLVAVSERTREIGIRTAIGARQRDVRLQFLVEAVLMSATGGALGVILGIGLAQGMTAWFGWPTDVQANVVLIAVAAAAGIGIAFGFLPASRAADLEPIDALRSE
jgi:putative ABC transport system permease protein